MIHIKQLQGVSSRSSSSRSSSRGMSLLEILVAIGIVALISIPAIQVIYSLRTDYITEIVQDTPILFDAKGETVKSQEILSSTYHIDGSIYSISKRGGMKEIYNMVQRGVFNRNICSDLNYTYDKNTQPTLYLYTADELKISSTTLLTGISLVGNSLLISADSASTSQPDIYAFTTSLIKTMTKPTLAIALAEDTGPGISQIQSRGTYIFTSNTGVRNQANIFRIGIEQDAERGNVVSTVSKKIDLVLPGSNSSTTPITKIILYANGKVFVGTEKSVLPEITIFNAKTGQVEHSIETGYGVNDMLVVHDLLVVAGPRDPEIEVFSLSTLQKVGEYDLPGGSGNAKVLTLFGDYVYVGRTKGGNEFTVLRMLRQNTNPMSRFVPLFVPVFSYKIRWSIDSILKSQKYTMLFTADEYSEFQLFESSGNTETSQEHTLLLKVDLPDRVSGAVCTKDGIWMTFKNTDGTNPYRLGMLVL